MKIIDNRIGNIQYVTYAYDNIDEKENHMNKMKLDGYECLENFEHTYEVVYRKFF